MNIGDRVRVLHGKEEGVIRKISAGGRIEVEIEDGFVIPVLNSEVVLVAEAEKQLALADINRATAVAEVA